MLIKLGIGHIHYKTVVHFVPLYSLYYLRTSIYLFIFWHILLSFRPKENVLYKNYSYQNYTNAVSYTVIV
jgi:hypothetical protein